MHTTSNTKVMSDEISILLCDDHSLVRNGIKALLEDEKDFKIVGEASNGREALDQVNVLQPDIVIMDIRMPVMNGLEAVAQLPEETNTKAIILSMHDSQEYVQQSIEAGAYGYLLKDAPKEELHKAIYRVFKGEKHFSADVSEFIVNMYLNKVHPNHENRIAPEVADLNLTKRERQILSMVLSGMSNKDIAESLDKSVRTVEAHRFNLMKKMEVKNVNELMAKARSLNIT